MALNETLTMSKKGVPSFSPNLTVRMTPEYRRWLERAALHKTGLTKQAAVVCSLVVPITRNQIQVRSGIVPPDFMSVVRLKTAARAKALGGWA